MTAINPLTVALSFNNTGIGSDKFGSVLPGTTYLPVIFHLDWQQKPASSAVSLKSLFTGHASAL